MVIYKGKLVSKYTPDPNITIIFLSFFLSQAVHGMTGSLVGLRGDKVQHVEAPLEV